MARQALDWDELADGGGSAWRLLRGTMSFGDISGFTKMSERLARHGKVGAEEVTEAIDSCFASLLDVAWAHGGQLVKFGGDAVLVLFEGPEHTSRGASAAVEMRSCLRSVGRLQTSAGSVTLRISMGLHSGEFHAFLVGSSHRELVITGPGITATVRAEGEAGAGEIIVSHQAAELLPDFRRGAARHTGFLLRAGRAAPVQAHLLGAPSPVDADAFVPVAVRRHLLDGGDEPEHRMAAVAFIHFDDADEILAADGPDDLADRLDTLVRTVQEAADRHQVTFMGTDVDENGGKLVLAGGVPRRIGDDEERLLTVVREVVDAGGPLDLRIGVHAGPVFAAAVGPRYRRTYTAMGDTVNLTARVMARAAPNQILATPEILERSRLAFHVDPVPAFAAKGKRALVNAFALGSPLASTTPGAPGAPMLPLKGRDQELELLQRALASAPSGSTRLVEIVAGQGLGKSRLVAELRRQADPCSPVMLVCESYEASTPYAPVRRLVRHLLGLNADEGASETADRLRDWTSERLPALDPVVPLIGAALDVEVDDTVATASLAPEFRRQRTEQALAELLREALSGHGLLIIDDAHHMDEASRTVLHRMAGDAGQDRTGTSPPGGLTIVVTRRDTSDPVLPEEPKVVDVVHLDPLSLEESVAAVVEATEDAPLLPVDVQAIARRSAGNPLFLESLLAGAHQRTDQESLPSSVDAAVTARIDRLPAGPRSILRAASVLGDIFTVEQLDELLQATGQRTVTDHLWGILGEFVEPVAPGTYRFRSVVVRESLYDALAFRRRRELHLVAARALLDKLGNEADMGAELLSIHFFLGQRFEEAWHYAMVAGNRAGAAYANTEAVVFYRRALASGRRLATIDPHDALAAWESLGEAYDRSGAYDQAALAYRNARQLVASWPVDLARLCLKSASVCERIGGLSKAVRWIRRGLRTLEGEPGAQAAAVRAELMARHGGVRQAQGRHREALRWCDKAVAESRVARERRPEANALVTADWAWASLGRWDKVTGSPTALSIYRQAGNLPGEALVLNNMGGFAYFRGRWDEAVSLYEQGRDVRLRMGDDSEAAFGTCNVGEVLADQGHYWEAEVRLKEALRIWRAAQFHLGIGYAKMFLARVMARTGRFSEAYEHLDSAAAEFTFANMPSSIQEVQACRAECLALHGRSKEALTTVDQVLSADDEDNDTGAPWVHRVRGVALLQLGDEVEGRRELEASVESAEARQARFDLALGELLLARTVRRSGDEAGAERLESSGGTMLCALGVQLAPDFPLSSREGA